jgi:hypothetical protein
MDALGGNYDDFYDALALIRPAKPARVWDLSLATEQLDAAGLGGGRRGRRAGARGPQSIRGHYRGGPVLGRPRPPVQRCGLFDEAVRVARRVPAL